MAAITVRKLDDNTLRFIRPARSRTRGAQKRKCGRSWMTLRDPPRRDLARRSTGSAQKHGGVELDSNVTSLHW